MNTHSSVDGILVQWGERLFYPGNRVVRPAPAPPLSGSVGQRAAAIRRHIHATVVRRAPQVMVKVTGGGRGMAAIAAHFRYISRNGQRPFEDDRGVVREGKEALHDLAEQWRYGGSFIEETSPRREAFNIMLSMPRGTDPLVVQRAAREFAKAELAEHRYVMVLHDHQANPHVHISVRAESQHGKRLNPRKADLQRWRETFAERLRGWGIDAEASRRRTRGQGRDYEPIWRIKAAEEGRLRTPLRAAKSGAGIDKDQGFAVEAWSRIVEVLSRSDSADDRALAKHTAQFLTRAFAIDTRRLLEVKQEPQKNAPTVGQALSLVRQDREGPEFQR